MNEVLAWLSGPAGSTLVGGLIAMYLLQGIKAAFKWQPGTDALGKQIAALVIAAVGGVALWAATGNPWDWGTWMTKAIEVFLGATTLHALIPAAAGGRSEESRTPCPVEDA